ncbi:GNAT family N-acetyltransferase [Chloroflexota bacterium]
MINIKLLAGERISLTAFTDDDVPPLADWICDLDLQRLVNPGPVAPVTAQELLAEDSWLSHDRKNPQSFVFAVRTKSDNSFIGVVALSDIHKYAQHAELGINIGHPNYRGKGYGTEAMTAILHYGFTELNLNRIFLNVFSYNAPARQLYDKMGFVQEVVKREWIFCAGQKHDEITMGLLRSEWETHHASRREAHHAG